MAITLQSGFPVGANGAGQSTLSVTPIAIGDLLVIGVRVVAGTPTVTGVSGGGVTTWVKAIDLVDSTDSRIMAIWYGTVTATGAQTVTLTFSSAIGSTTVEIIAESFTGLSSWVARSSNSILNGTNNSGGTITGPSLTSPSTPSLYWGYARASTAVSSASTSGFTYYITPGGNDVAWNGACNASTAYAPDWLVTANSNYDIVAVMFGPVATVAATGSLTPAGSLSSVLNHSVYRQTVATDPGLVSYWRMDEASGNILDSKGTNHGAQGTLSTLLPAGAGADDAAVGTLAWTNPGNIDGDITTFATAGVISSNATTHYLKSSAHGFAIPAGATITGIQAEIRRSVGSSNTVTDSRVRLIKAGVIQTPDKADLVTSWPVVAAYAAYGGSTDLWGGTWTPSDINSSGFGLALSATCTSSFTNPAMGVSVVRITVYYTTTGLTRQVAGLITADSDTAISGDGALGSMIYIPNASSLNPTSQITVEAWIKPTTYDTVIRANTNYLIIGKDEVSDQYSLKIDPGSLSFLFFVHDVTANDVWVYSAFNTVVPNTVQHVVGVYDAAGRIQIFVNGVSSGTPSSTPHANIATTTSRVTLFCDYTNQNGFQGTIDEVALYNTALSASTIARHYSAGLARLQTDTGSGALLLAGPKTESRGQSDVHGGTLSLTGSKVSSFTQVAAANGRLLLSGTAESATYLNVGDTSTPITGRSLPFTEVWGRHGWV